MGEVLAEEYLLREIEELESRKAWLDEQIERVEKEATRPKAGPVMWRAEDELLVESATLRNAPRASGEKPRRVLVLDRENGCFKFLAGARKIPAWLDLYFVWNPRTTHVPDFVPKVRDRINIVEAEHSTHKAIATLAGIVGRDYFNRGEHEGADFTFAFNCSNAPERYAETEALLKKVGVKVHRFDGSVMNYADYLTLHGTDYRDYTDIAPLKRV